MAEQGDEGGAVTPRELDARLEEIRRAVDLALNSSGGQRVKLRDHLEALRASDQRALDMASEERAKAAEALRDEQRRALDVAQEEREKAAKALSAGTDRAIADNYDRISDRLTAYEHHIEVLLAEKDRAVEMATEEREKAAKALREEQQHAAEVAEHEREKAAEALRTGLDRAIKEGDERLREHVLSQIERITADLVSADKLEIARIDAVRNQLTDAVEAASQAVGKAEVAVDKRLEGAPV